MRSRLSILVTGLMALTLALPAFAFTRTGGTTTGPATGATGSTAAASRVPTGSAAVFHEGVVQGIDAGAGSIVINATRYVIGAPLLALVDKRPHGDGLLTLASVKIGMVVRYRVDRPDGVLRVVELWVLRDAVVKGSFK